MKLIKTNSGIIAGYDELKSAEISGENVWKNKHIIAGTPNTLKLKFSPEVSEVLGVWDVEEEAKEYSKGKSSSSVFKEAHELDFKNGFTRHAELNKKKEFTEEDMLKAMNYASDLTFLHNKMIHDNSFKPFIQSLREFTVADFEQSEDTLTILKLK